MIEPAADYSFNKSHAACYAFISYQTAWLKAHYPLEFHAALLRSVEQEPDKLAGFIQEVQLQ
jgi:DNA polymerase III subunit alpha